MKTVLISGGTGLIGKYFTNLLLKKQFKVIILSRKKISTEIKGLSYMLWNPENQFIEKEALKQSDIVLNLAGRNLGDKRWNKIFKKELYDSRVLSTRFLSNSFKNAGKYPKVWINASGVSYYGYHREKQLTEVDEKGDNFLSELCNDWEQEALKTEQNGVRVCVFRLGIVITKEGGALEKLETPVKFWVGAALGTGNQIVPWIDIEDLCELFLFAIENNSISGIYNAVAPKSVTNKEMTKQIAHFLNKPLLMPAVPIWTLKILLGEMSDLLTGNLDVSSKKIQNMGFEFKYPDLESTLRKLYQNNIETARLNI